jgi:transposase
VLHFTFESAYWYFRKSWQPLSDSNVTSPGLILENVVMALSEATKKRLKAGRMLLRGKSCAEVALAVGVARQTVYTWKRLLDEDGIDALRAVPERGRPAQLDKGQLVAVGNAVLQSPTEHGFATELWTLKRVGTVIERMHGVRFSQTQVWRLLGSLGFSPQKPEKRAIERDEDAVRNWKRRTWPALKKKPGAKAARSSS